MSGFSKSIAVEGGDARTEQVQGLRLMKFEIVYGRTPGVACPGGSGGGSVRSERMFRRWRDRYEAEGADGLYEPPGPPSHGAAARRWHEVARVLELFGVCWRLDRPSTLVEVRVGGEARLSMRTYNWLRLSQAHGRRRAAPRRGAQAAQAPGIAEPWLGMMLQGRLEPRLGPR